MKAEVVSVGTELLLGQIIDTHAPTMARVLAECGISCQRRATVGDNFDRVVQVISEALDRAEIVITIGGLGPTQDDLTRDAIAKALGDELIREPEYERELKELFESRGLKFVESNLKQADRPASGRFIENPNGTAPGLLCEKNGKKVIALPGPKNEFEPMVKRDVRGILEQASGGKIIHSHVLKVCGLGESYVESLLQDLVSQESPTVAPYAHTGEVHLRVTAVGATIADCEAELAPTIAEIKSRLGDAVYGSDEIDFEGAVMNALIEGGFTVATAESVTGGGLSARLTSIAGSSAAYTGSIVAYSREAKVLHLGVKPETYDLFGPVSEEVVREMAECARSKFGVDFAVATSGNAGPTADFGDKPVGLCLVAVAGPNGISVRSSNFRGTRDDIRRRAEQTALFELRKQIFAVRNGLNS